LHPRDVADTKILVQRELAEIVATDKNFTLW
jgi:hypothetical protein